MSYRLTFKNRIEFRQWLEKNHDTHDAVWLVFGKEGRIKTLHPNEALKEALCYGWIDGLIKRVDNDCYIKRFSHRRKKSIWSKRNRDFVDKLVSNGKMTEFGLEEIDRAKRNGSWERPEPPPLSKEQIGEFVKKIEGHEPAYSNLINMPPSVTKIYTMHYMSAKKEETKIRRLGKIIDRLNNNLKPM